MADYRDDLIRLFASTPVDQIKQNAEYQQLCAAHVGDLLFNEDCHRIEIAKKRLEGLLDNAMTRAEQVRSALTELRRRRGDPLQKLYYQLIMAGYEPQWSDAQKGYFQRAWRLIQSKYDFFLSFTTRHHPPDEDNLVNTYCRHFISVYGDSTKLGQPDAKRKNQLAYAIRPLLSDNGRRSEFFFETHPSDNQIVETKLREACRSSLVFVQPVRSIMFRPPDKRPNYCFFEYNEAAGYILPDLDGEQRMLFIVAEDFPDALPDPSEVPLDYDLWYKHLRAKAALYLERLGVYDEARIEALRETIEREVGRKLGAAWQRIFQGVPD
jgi:hypothetical protein